MTRAAAGTPRRLRRPAIDRVRTFSFIRSVGARTRADARGRLWCALWLALALLASPAAARRTPAQTVSEAQLRAAFLINFAKFAEWPSDALAPSGTLAFCTVDDAAVADALEQILKSADGRVAHGGTVVRLTVSEALQTQESPARRCHLLYVASLDAKRAPLLAAAVAAAPVFTVGGSTGFADAGGIAELYQDHGKLRFAINVEAAQRARVRLGAPLLRLARIVKGPERQGL